MLNLTLLPDKPRIEPQGLDLSSLPDKPNPFVSASKNLAPIVSQASKIVAQKVIMPVLSPNYYKGTKIPKVDMAEVMTAGLSYPAKIFPLKEQGVAQERESSGSARVMEEWGKAVTGQTIKSLNPVRIRALWRQGFKEADEGKPFGYEQLFTKLGYNPPAAKALSFLGNAVGTPSGYLYLMAASPAAYQTGKRVLINEIQNAREITAEVSANIDKAIKQGVLDRNAIMELKRTLPPETFDKISRLSKEMVKIVKTEPIGPLKPIPTPSAVEMPGVQNLGVKSIELGQVKVSAPEIPVSATKPPIVAPIAVKPIAEVAQVAGGIIKGLDVAKLPDKPKVKAKKPKSLLSEFKGVTHESLSEYDSKYKENGLLGLVRKKGNGGVGLDVKYQDLVDRGIILPAPENVNPGQWVYDKAMEAKGQLINRTSAEDQLIEEHLKQMEEKYEDARQRISETESAIEKETPEQTPEETLATADEELPEWVTEGTIAKPTGEGKVIDNLNPNGKVFTDYTPEVRATMPLGKNITTLDKTSNKSPDEMVTIYRGAGKGKEIVAGDFITTNKQLAKDYAGTGNIIEKKVKLSDILDDKTEPLGEEYIYRPKLSTPTGGKPTLEVQPTMPPKPLRPVTDQVEHGELLKELEARPKEKQQTFGEGYAKDKLEIWIENRIALKKSWAKQQKLPIDFTKWDDQSAQLFEKYAETKGLGADQLPQPKSYGEGMALEEGKVIPPEEHVSRVEMPEIVKMAVSLSGNFPKVKNLAKYLGYHKAGNISLDPKIFKNPYLAGNVLAHEIGHLADWLPDYVSARGNILGRIASLVKYMGSMIEALPESGEALLTDKERSRIRYRAVKEIGEKDKEGIKKRYKEMLQEEAESRGLITRDEVMVELKKLTQYWNPFTEVKGESYTEYRYKSKELYADAFSVLVNQPEKVKEIAPKFYKSWWAYLDKKEEVKQTFLELEDFLALGPGEKGRIREADIRNMFKKGEELFYELRNRYTLNRKNMWYKLKTELIDKNMPILEKLKEAENQGKKLNPEDNPKYFLEEYNYIGGKIKNLMEDINQDVVAPLIKIGASAEDLGEYLFLNRVVTERADIANPLGHNPKTAQDQLGYLKKTLGDKWDTLTKSAERFQQILKALLKQANEAGFYKEETFAEIITNPAYATFQVLDYLDDYVTPGVIHQIGTLKPIANPLVSTTLKMISLLRAIERIKTNNSVIKFIQKDFPGEIEQAKVRRFGKYKAELVEKEGFGIIKTREEGKLTGYYVDPYIAECLEYQPASTSNAVLGIFKFLNRSYFRPVYVGLNLGFQTFNLMRDFQRAWKLNPNVNFPKMLKTYKLATPIAFRRIWGAMPDSVIDEMQENGMLSFTYNNLMRGEGEENITEMEFILKQYDVIKKNPENPVKKIINWIEEIGDFIETLPKVAGYLSRLRTGQNIKEMAHEVRVYSGSPDFLRKGQGYEWYNNVFLFSNAIKEGFRGDIEGAFKNPKTRSAYWWRTAKLNILTKILMFLAAAGYFGKAIKDNYDKQSEYIKTNYITIPLGIFPNGKAFGIRIPQDEVGRLIGALFWKAINADIKDPVKTLGEVSSVMGGQIPSIAPTAELVVGTTQYLTGQSPYDFYRGRAVLTDDEKLAGGWYALKPMGGWVAGKLGINALNVQTRTGNENIWEKIKRFTPIVGRYFYISDYGKKEQDWERKEPRKKMQAERRLNLKELRKK